MCSDSQRTVILFLETCALVLRDRALVKNSIFFLQTLLFTAFLVHTCEHMILGQLRMGARQTKNAPLYTSKNWWPFASGIFTQNIKTTVYKVWFSLLGIFLCKLESSLCIWKYSHHLTHEIQGLKVDVLFLYNTFPKKTSSLRWNQWMCICKSEFNWDARCAFLKLVAPYRCN